MEEVLKKLKVLREERDVSLEEISKATKIPLDKLKALEEGDLSRLPEPVFIVGYVEKYLRYLRVDPGECIGEVKRCLEEARSEIVPEQLKQVKRERKVLRYLVVCLGAFVFLLGLYYGFNAGKRGIVRIIRVKRVEIPVSNRTEASAVTPGKVESPGLSGNKTPAEPLHPVPEKAVMVASSPCWIRFIDGEGRVREFLLKKGDSAEAKLPVLLRVGSAGALSIVIDNRSYGGFGKVGAVVNLAVDSEGVRKIKDVPKVLKKPFPGER